METIATYFVWAVFSMRMQVVPAVNTWVSEIGISEYIDYED